MDFQLKPFNVDRTTGKQYTGKSEWIVLVCCQVLRISNKGHVGQQHPRNLAWVLSCSPPLLRYSVVFIRVLLLVHLLHSLPLMIITSREGVTFGMHCGSCRRKREIETQPYILFISLLSLLYGLGVTSYKTGLHAKTYLNWVHEDSGDVQNG